jgi:hypothetical protein
MGRIGVLEYDVRTRGIPAEVSNRGFKLTTEDTTTMLLDFDGDRSIHQTGNGTYMMNPVIGIVRVD